MVTQFGHAGTEKSLDRVAGLLEHAPVDGKARAFEREYKALRHFASPFAERRRRLRTVERAVDLDRGQVLAGIGQFLGVRQALGIEHPAPRLEGPAADPDKDIACFRSLHRGHEPVTNRCYMSASSGDALY